MSLFLSWYHGLFRETVLGRKISNSTSLMTKSFKMVLIGISVQANQNSNTQFRNHLVKALPLWLPIFTLHGYWRNVEKCTLPNNCQIACWLVCSPADSYIIHPLAHVVFDRQWLVACLLACLTSQQHASVSEVRFAPTVVCAAILR